MATEENEDGLVVNEGFIGGLSKEKMLDLMDEHGIDNADHIKMVAIDLPI